jgi:uncharacterized membrane protein
LLQTPHLSGKLCVLRRFGYQLVHGVIALGMDDLRQFRNLDTVKILFVDELIILSLKAHQSIFQVSVSVSKKATAVIIVHLFSDASVPRVATATSCHGGWQMYIVYSTEMMPSRRKPRNRLFTSGLVISRSKDSEK